MAADKSIILSWLADLAASIVTDVDDLADVTARIEVAAALNASGFATEALGLMRVVAESVNDAAGFGRIAIPQSVEAGDTHDAMAVLLAMALSVAGARVTWLSRRHAKAARTRIGTVGEAGMAIASKMGADGADLYAWLSAIVAVACRLISDIAANTTPIVTVRSGVSLPSTVLAYQLYGDATRAQALVDIAGSATPLVMPTSFDALAS